MAWRLEQARRGACKILAARAETGDGTPGFALDENLLIACGDGALRLTRLQREGKRPADLLIFCTVARSIKGPFSTTRWKL